jgi:hypothetical protein
MKRYGIYMNAYKTEAKNESKNETKKKSMRMRTNIPGVSGLTDKSKFALLLNQFSFKPMQQTLVYPRVLV